MKAESFQWFGDYNGDHHGSYMVTNLTTIETNRKIKTKSSTIQIKHERERERAPAVSQRPRFTVFPSTITLALKLSKTVGM